MSDELVAAYLRERDGYQRRALHDMVALVDEQLRLLGVDPPDDGPTNVETAGGGSARRRSGRR